MILAVDSSALALLVNPAANPPDDPATGQPVTHARERIEHFLSGLTANDTLVIPAPVLAEALVRAGEGGPALKEALSGLARVKIRPFGERAAIETAAMTREAIQAGDKKAGSDAPWQKVKVDRQVIAVARVEGSTRIYADDYGLVAFARRLGMDAFSTWDLPVPEQVRNLFTAAGVPIEPTPPMNQPRLAAADRSSPELDGADIDTAPVDEILRDLDNPTLPPVTETGEKPAAGETASSEHRPQQPRNPRS